MSSFKDNFKRDSEEDMLEYDDSAFYYFSIAVLTFIALPYTAFLLRDICYGGVNLATQGTNCGCSSCQTLLAAKQIQARKTIFRSGFLFRLVVGAFIWYLWTINFQTVTSIEGLQSFDPFQILDIPNDATMRDIRKQYRRLSLLKHPDKNPDNPLAVQEFIRLTKAYSILTDETARENFRKYGNPDGPGSYNVAIALPKALLEKENQVQVLLCAFFILLVILPGVFYFNFGKSTQQDEGGVELKNKSVFGQLLNENMLLKNMPQVMARSIEFQNLVAKNKGELPLLRQLKDDPEISELLPKVISRQTKNQNLKPILLILGMLKKHPNVSHQLFQKDVDFIRKMGPQLANMMVEVCNELTMMRRLGQSLKHISLRTFSTVIEYQQRLVQNIWINDDPLMQLPHFDESVVKAYKKQLKDFKIPKGDIDTFCRLSPDTRAKLNLFKGDQNKLKDLEAAIRVMPVISVSAIAETENESEIAMTDVATIKFTVKLDLAKEDVGLGFAHSLRYPYLKKPQWHLLITTANTKDIVVVNTKFLIKEKSEYVFETKQRMEQPGKQNFHVFIKSDSYLGFDKECNLDFEVKREPTKERAVPEYAKEDVMAVKGPGLVQSMLDINAEQSDSDEDSDEGLTEIEKLKKDLQEAGLQDALEVNEKSNIDKTKGDPKLNSQLETKKDK